MFVTAFIPVREGSKSIPLKNIKPFCGKPLVCWSIEALESCDEINEIVVATDSAEIEKTVVARKYRKTKIFRRSAENASDTASTESVMLEYITAAQLPGERTFMLVQATSPLTQPRHFSEAMRMHESGKYDSVLSCVRNRRFFWNADGTSANYDYRNRPRRQDFDGILMENGAFYISSVKNILASGNRLSGRIGIYEMPEYTATEMDEPDDWKILEQLMYRHVLAKKQPNKRVKLFLADVDGTLTDGGMYYSEDGNELKKFNARDGLGIRLLREAGIKVGIITSENTRIVENRTKKLQVDYLCQGEKDGGKLAAAEDICQKEHIAMEEVAYIGDDVNCIDLLRAVGFAACPADALERVKNIPHIRVMESKGGCGCVREWADEILALNNALGNP